MLYDIYKSNPYIECNERALYILDELRCIRGSTYIDESIAIPNIKYLVYKFCLLKLPTSYNFSLLYQPTMSSTSVDDMLDEIFNLIIANPPK